MGKVFDALAKAGGGVQQTALMDEKPSDHEGGQDEWAGHTAEEISGGISGGMDPRLICASHPNSPESEQFKMLRTKLLHPLEGSVPRTIMVTSTVPGEGKSFVASNLAVSIAQNINEYVLLIDSDLRRSSVHKIFGIESKVGLAEYLSDGISLENILRKTSIQKLTIIPGGRSPSNPSELLTSNKMYAFLEEVKNRYSDRIIIIDSPPPHFTAESKALAGKVDGIVLVIKYGITSRKAARSLVDLIGRDKVIGVVFNQVEMYSVSSGAYSLSRKYNGYYGRK